jgi:TonB family protein
MKAIGIGIAAALAVTSAAKADVFADNALWVEVKYDLLKAKWPHDADGNLIYGRVLLDCAIGANHFATGCTVKASEPENPAIERAALDLAPLYRTWKTWDSRLSRATLLIDVQYDERAELLKKPSYAQMMDVLPRGVQKPGDIDVATIKCVVQTTGISRACSVVSEDRPGLGFGPAAQVLAQTFLFRPATRQGHVIEAEATLPVKFQMISGDSQTPGSGSSTRVQAGAAWSKAPSVSEVLGEIDKKVGDKFADGQVVMQCKLSKKTGKLGGCYVASTSPGMAQFQGVASALIPKFQADPAALAAIKEDVMVSLAFAFPDMASPEWGKRYLTNPEWIQTFDPASKISSFPDAAAKAGLKTGTATVDCVVAPNGALTHCQTVRESAPDVGFGDTAIKIAETFVANPWNDNGLPVEGAHIRMPIQMDYKPSASSPTPATKP